MKSSNSLSNRRIFYTILECDQRMGEREALSEQQSEKKRPPVSSNFPSITLFCHSISRQTTIVALKKRLVGK